MLTIIVFFCAKKREKIKSNSKLIDSYAYYGIPKIKGKSQYAYGLNDVFALTNIILYLSAPLQRTIFVLGFTAITEHYSKKFINISMDEILYKMGFFKEWKEKLLVPYPINKKVDFNWNFKLTPVSKL